MGNQFSRVVGRPGPDPIDDSPEKVSDNAERKRPCVSTTKPAKSTATPLTKKAAKSHIALRSRMYSQTQMAAGAQSALCFENRARTQSTAARGIRRRIRD